MPRIIGTETEYGIATPSWPQLSPIITSTHAVVGYASTLAATPVLRPRWDYGAESPQRDLRGMDNRRYQQSPVVDPNTVGVANVVTPTGARLYVDHAHPEYSAPETTDAFEAMIYDQAGDLVLRRAIEAVAERTAAGESALEGQEPCPPLKIYKNNVDGKGASYGSHENYRYLRSTDFDALAQALIPFFVARQVIIGAGRVGLGPEGEEVGFQISQRADYIETEISLETTLNRGIINTRDEPHANASQYGRLHVIIGDANMSQTATFIKLGMTALVLDSIESGVDFSDLRLVDPVAEVRRVSRDVSLTHGLELRDGRVLTALEILNEYRRRVVASTASERRVLEVFDEVVDLLAQDPLLTAHLLDWTAKYKLISAYLARGLAMSDHRMALVDLQYSDIDPAKSLYHALVRKGQMRELVAYEQIEQAALHPPQTTRAYFRGKVSGEFGAHVVAANWQHMTLKPDLDSERVVAVDITVNKNFSQASVGALIDSAVAKGEINVLLNGLPEGTVSDKLG